MKDKPDINKDSFIRDCHLSLRTENVLYDNSEVFGIKQTFSIMENNLRVSDIGKLSLRDIGGFRNCGKKTLLEIKELCMIAGMKLK